MKRTKSNKAAAADEFRVKLRVDSKTLIVVRNQTALDMWLTRYPAAQVVE
ncbi:MAG: hypothetical protein MUC87_16925 [Bacteroidia bacterium]|jgi:hypothetical protein|nr:hypothetical protein [Bacteroidia bacterium]